ncbi:hypothetical protein [Flavobacterium sp.]|uniref:McrB family protein n=1 Tax=Flavobacterium sp. TaxID=239 RepID=UPI00260937E2|nr:hypothetical protein [Flavobacterium sp.]
MEKFKIWLETFIPNSLSNYISGIEKINRILNDSTEININQLTLENIDSYKKRMLENADFKDFNKSNNIGTATISNYKKFLETEQVIPTLDNDEVKWFWTTGTPTNGYNSPFILCEVTKLFHNYKRGDELNIELRKLEDRIKVRNKFKAEKEAGLVLSQERDVLTQFGQYWKFFNLTDQNSRDVKLTRFGEKIATEELTIEDFIEFQIENITQKTIDGKINSLKLILNLIGYLYKINSNEAYIRVEELINILPYIYLNIFSIKQLSHCILYYRRKEPDLIEKGFFSKITTNEVRFVTQHFLFLLYSEKLIVKNISGKNLYYLNYNNEHTKDNLNIIENPLKLNFNNMPFNYKSFHKKTKEAGLIFSEKMVARFIASLCTKPFVICSGLSGSGKTKLAQAFVQWICESEEQYKIIPVGADWTNREPLLGYPNGLNENLYVKPDSGALDVIFKALDPNNKNKPFFLILDEMNLSHVERYFADFLSIMESKDKIKLHSGDTERGGVAKDFEWPKNLFIIGTVNIDETTYMFSPKVLDRANVIEFRISKEDLKIYLDSDKVLNMDKFLNEDKTFGLGSEMSESFLKLAKEDAKHTIDNKSILLDFFRELQKAGAEFGYRSTFEINRLIAILNEISKDDKTWDGKSINENEFIDIAIMQKLLPKLHGSRNKLTRVLPILGGFCINETKKEKIKEIYFDKVDEIDFKADDNIIYKLSFEKICRMYKNAIENGYASYAEA